MPAHDVTLAGTEARPTEGLVDFAIFERELRAGFDATRSFTAAPDDAAIAQMLVHARTLFKWNQTHSLTSVKTPREWASALFVDAWLVTGVCDDWSGTLIDVGAGGGFPGLVVLAARPSHPAILFEKVEKKRSFLTAAVAAMKLSATTVARAAFPAPLPDGRRVFVSRATWAPEEWLAIAQKEARAGDTIIVQASQEALPPNAALARETTLPFSSAQRKLARYDVR